MRRWLVARLPLRVQARRKGMRLQAIGEDLRAALLHLRLHFSVVLLPLFLWGFRLTGARPSGAFGLGLLAVHVFLYGGANAFNSYFDRDEGPIGGLYRPPPVSTGTLAVALAFKALGLLLGLRIGWAFTGVYLGFVVLSVLYSHPWTRWKARPVLSVLTVAVGQGGLGFLAGWLCGRDLAMALTTFPGLAGLVTAMLFTAGLYPITQAYQVSEDARRGDTTFVVRYGLRRAFRLAQALLALAGLLLVGTVAALYTAYEAIGLAVYGLAGFFVLTRLERAFPRRSLRANYRSVMALVYGNGLVFTVYLAARIALS
ncbi:hypothetical protein HRbin11_00971 [bacterium HR11]|nr:hypothetical protein HRbin11_00971 [bacterium HR11]